MIIARTIESFYPYISGPANQAYMISSLLEKNSISSPILTTDYMAEGSPSQEEKANVNVRRFPVKAGFMRFLYTPELKKRLNAMDFDIAHAHNYRNYQAEVAYSVAKAKKKPFVLHAHGSLIGYKHITTGISKMPYLAYDLISRKRAALQADAVIVSSRQEKEEALAFGVEEERLHIIPMGIDVRKYCSESKAGDMLRLLFVGRITRDRNLFPILDAMQRLHDDKISLKIVGGKAKRSSTEKDGYYEELMDYAKKNKLNVEFTGELSGDRLIDAYKSADAFIYTSVWENFGQTILEAAASGLPVISTPVGIAPEIVDENTGFLLGSADPEEIALAIRKLKEPKIRSEMGETIVRRVKRDYNWQDIMMRYEKLYLSLFKR